MLTSKNISGAAIATAAALLFISVPITTRAGEAGKMHCDGVNSCKGQSSCKSATNSCKGQNSCKGKGFSEMSKAECDAAKAKLTKP